MHRRQRIREEATIAIGAIAASVKQEWTGTVPPELRPLISVSARVEALEVTAGTMGAPDDRRVLQLQFDIHTHGKTSVAAVDKINDLDEALGGLLDAANQPGQAFEALSLDFRWSETDIRTESTQDKFLAFGTVIYTALYDLPFGQPT